MSNRAARIRNFEFFRKINRRFYLQEYVVPGEEDVKPSKDEYNVGKWLRKNVPIKKTKFLNHNVEYFTGTKV